MDVKPQSVEPAQLRAETAKTSPLKALWNRCVPVHWVGEALAPMYVMVLGLVFLTLILALNKPDVPGGFRFTGVRAELFAPDVVRVTTREIPEVAVGDRLLRIDGAKVRGWRETYHHASAHSERAASLDFERPDGTSYTLSVKPVASKPVSALPGMCWLLGALLLAWLWPKGGGVFAFFLFSASLAVGVLGAASAPLIAEMHPIAFLLTRCFTLGGIPVALGLMALTLPYPVAFLRKEPRLTYLALVPGTVIPLALAGTEYEAIAWEGMIGFSLLLSIAVPLIRLRAPRSRTSRKQLRVMLCLPLFAAFPAVVAFRFPEYLALSQITSGMAMFLVLGFVSAGQDILDFERSTLKLGLSTLYIPLALAAGYAFALLHILQGSPGSPLKGSLATIVVAALALRFSGRILALFGWRRLPLPRVFVAERDSRRTIRDVATLLAKLPLKMAAPKVEASLRILLVTPNVHFLRETSKKDALYRWVGKHGQKALTLAAWRRAHPRAELHNLRASEDTSGKAQPYRAVELSLGPKPRRDFDPGQQEMISRLLEAMRAAMMMRKQAKAHIPGYRIYSRLAVGGMGEIYLGQRSESMGAHQLCVLKLMRGMADGQEDLEAMFMSEFEILRDLNHENIVSVDGAGRTYGGHLYIAMEYVDGADLAQVIRLVQERRQKTPLEMIFSVADALLQALSFAHRGIAGKPIVHRDVSPDNILVALDGTLKLSDFGVATLAKGGDSSIAGKVDYMAPELFAEEAVESHPRMDVYSLGILLYELALGEHPYREETSDRTRARACEAGHEDIRALRPDLPAELGTLIMRALSFEPEARYSDARAMRNAFKEISLPPGYDTKRFTAEIGAMCREVSAGNPVFGTCYLSAAGTTGAEATMVRRAGKVIS